MFTKINAQQIDSNTWVIKQSLMTSKTYCYLLEGSHSALLIDTGYSMGNLADTVKKITSKKLHVVNTHAHLDHMGNNYQFDELYLNPIEMPVLLLHEDQSFLENMFKHVIPAPARVLLNKNLKAIKKQKLTSGYKSIKDGFVFDLGERLVEVLETPGHSVGSICLFDQKKKRIYSGDTVCARGVLLNLDYSCPVHKYYSSLEKLLCIQNDISEIFAGHHTIPIGAKYIKKYMSCVNGFVDGSLKRRRGMSAGSPSIIVSFEDISIAVKPEDTK